LELEATAMPTTNTDSSVDGKGREDSGGDHALIQLASGELHDTTKGEAKIDGEAEPHNSTMGGDMGGDGDSKKVPELNPTTDADPAGLTAEELSNSTMGGDKDDDEDREKISELNLATEVDLAELNALAAQVTTLKDQDVDMDNTDNTSGDIDKEDVPEKKEKKITYPDNKAKEKGECPLWSRPAYPPAHCVLICIARIENRYKNGSVEVRKQISSEFRVIRYDAMVTKWSSRSKWMSILRFCLTSRTPIKIPSQMM
jgi:hypothetical protein